MTRPEEVLALPLVARRTLPLLRDANKCALDESEYAAVAIMCNAYPLALKLAEACEGYMEQPTSGKHAIAMAAALAAFLAHRQEDTK